MQPADIKKCCDLLEIGPDADIRQVNRAYRDLAAVWHPDRFAGNSRLAKKAEVRLKALNAARTALLQHLSRQKNDPSPQRTSTGKKTPRDTAVQVLNRPRPLLRCFARVLDYSLLGLFIVYVDLEAGIAVHPATLFFYPFAAGFLWIFFEAGLLSTVGTTPGKWLIHTEIIPRTLRPPAYIDALRRCLRVWVYGSGACLLPLCIVTAVGSCRYLVKKKYAPWDAAEGFFISHRPLGTRGVALVLTATALLGLYHPFLRKQAAGLERVFPVFSGAADVSPAIPPQPDDDVQGLMRHAVLLIEKGHYRQAIDVLARITSLQPDTARVRFLVGFALAKQGQHHQAVTELRQAIALDPVFARAYHTLGLVYLNLENRRLAMEQYQALQKIDKALAEELLNYIRGSQPPPPDTRWTHDFFLSNGFHIPCNSV